jgi:hypothetical protein
MLQAIASASKYHAKIESHRSAADQFNTLLTRLRFEMELPNEENFSDEIETQIIEVKNKCNFYPPQFIIDEYHIRQHNKRLNGEKRGSKNKFKELSEVAPVNSAPVNSDAVIDINSTEVIDGVSMDIGSSGRLDNSKSVQGDSGLNNDDNNSGESLEEQNGSSVV